MKQAFQGKTAEEIEKIAEAEATRGRVAFKKAADAYRHQGALAITVDPKRALQLYIRSSEIDPTNPEVWHGLMTVYTILGDMAAADRARKKMEAVETKKLQEPGRVQR